MTATVASAPPAPPLDPTTGMRRVIGAFSLPLAFVLQLLCNAIYAIVSTESGLVDTEGTAEALELYGRYPGQLLACSLLAMIGVLVMLPGLPTALRVLRPSRPRLALVAVWLMIVGYVCYFAIVARNFDSLPLAQHAIAHPDAGVAALLDAAPTHPAMMVFFLLFAIGNLIGTLLLGLAVMLSRALPWWAGALIMGWPAGHIANLVVGDEWFAVAGGALEIAGLCVVAAAALRTSDAEWARRG